MREARTRCPLLGLPFKRESITPFAGNEAGEEEEVCEKGRLASPRGRTPKVKGEALAVERPFSGPSLPRKGYADFRDHEAGP